MGEGLMVPGCGWQRGQISPGDMVPSALTLKREFSLGKSQAGALTEARGVGGAKILRPPSGGACVGTPGHKDGIAVPCLSAT